MASQSQAFTSHLFYLACPMYCSFHRPCGSNKKIKDPGGHFPNHGANLAEDSFLLDALLALLPPPVSWPGAEKVTAAAPSRSGEQVSAAAAFAAQPPHFQRAGDSLARPLTGVVSADGKAVCRGVTCSKAQPGFWMLRIRMPSLCKLLSSCATQFAAVRHADLTEQSSTGRDESAHLMFGRCYCLPVQER